MNAAVLWGIPMVCIDLVGVPLRAWPFNLMLLVPGTIGGVVVLAALEHWLFLAVRKHRDRQ